MIDQSVSSVLGQRPLNYRVKKKKKEEIYASLPEKLPFCCIYYADQTLSNVVS